MFCHLDQSVMHTEVVSVEVVVVTPFPVKPPSHSVTLQKMMRDFMDVS